MTKRTFWTFSWLFIKLWWQYWIKEIHIHVVQRYGCVNQKLYFFHKKMYFEYIHTYLYNKKILKLIELLMKFLNLKPKIGFRVFFCKYIFDFEIWFWISFWVEKKKLFLIHQNHLQNFFWSGFCQLNIY